MLLENKNTHYQVIKHQFIPQFFLFSCLLKIGLPKYTFQEYALLLLSIMHCQHDNGFSLVLLLLKFFSFLPHMLQRVICLCFFSFFFIPKRVLLFAVAATPSPLALQIAYRIHRHRYYSSTAPSFLQ